VINTVNKKRQLLVLCFFCLAFLFVTFRLFYLQIIRSRPLKNQADAQHTTIIKSVADRGVIYDINKLILASNIGTNSVYAVPKNIKDKQRAALILSSILELDNDMVEARLKKDKWFVWIKRKITKDELVALKNADIPNIGFIDEPMRFYPNGILGCHLIGFTDIDSKGIEGIELSYEKYLKGRPGWRKVLRDARGFRIPSLGDELPPRKGYSLVLTVDNMIQHIVEKEIDEIVSSYRPRSVSIIAMNPGTGEIFAMASYPRFDPNDYTRASADLFKNRCLGNSIEPGSVFKIITASAALEENLVHLEDKIYCENGNYKVRNRMLHDYRPYGTLTFREVIEKSSNIGTIKVAEKIGKKRLFQYITKFGFGSVSGIDLPGEENGILRDVSGWSYVDMTTIPMGQGISCTAMQLANSISVIANGGMLMRPRIVKMVIDSNENVVKEYRPEGLRRVISIDTASKMKELLYGVVERGTGKRAKLKGYDACGKTGTAQKVGKDGKYSKNKFVATFIGFAPLENPRVVLVVCVDEPKGNHFGGTVAAPAFKNVMQKVLQYLEV